MRGLLAGVLVLTAAATADDPPTRVSMAWAQAWNAKDVSALMRLYAPDPVFLPTSGDRWTGAAALQSYFVGGLSEHNPALVMHSLRSDRSETMAYDSGTYTETITPVHGGVTLRLAGNYLFVLKRVAGGPWLLQEQIFSESNPAKF